MKVSINVVKDWLKNFEPSNPREVIFKNRLEDALKTVTSDFDVGPMVPYVYDSESNTWIPDEKYWTAEYLKDKKAAHPMSLQECYVVYAYMLATENVSIEDLVGPDNAPFGRVNLSSFTLTEAEKKDHGKALQVLPKDLTNSVDWIAFDDIEADYGGFVPCSREEILG